MKFFLWMAIISALAMTISTGMQWEHAYIVFWIAFCTMIIGSIGTIALGGGKKLWAYLEKIL